MYSIKDVIKKSFLEGFTANDISAKNVVLVLLVTAMIASYIFIVYKIMCRKTFYSKNFNISLVGVSLITAAIIITIQTSVVVSLGMVGALSIVRFRTAIKDPLDLMFLFWSISTGIICGAGYAEYAIILAIILTIVVLVLNHLPIAKAPMILIVNANSIDSEDTILNIIKGHSKNYTVKSRSVVNSALTLTVEIATKDVSSLVKELSKGNDVSGVSALAHDGEVTF
ncbi:DUF4956 domain-containing protein [Butyrivibrio sp. WCD3002]|uniref:DUF4956 domain-containing protein n=1 Tax=Butyrivibrio sp. WCD3002 TaxID=1280676 RepID=UPI00040E5145|nr:DUF4956 domain-containing protein [Butyrivibrio sp. WCD3002]